MLRNAHGDRETQSRAVSTQWALKTLSTLSNSRFSLLMLRFPSLCLFPRICPITPLNSTGGLLLGYQQVTHSYHRVVKMKVFPNKDDSLASGLRVKQTRLLSPSSNPSPSAWWTWQMQTDSLSQMELHEFTHDFMWKHTDFKWCSRQSHRGGNVFATLFTSSGSA